jgi:hydroxymethylpyrimidine pyrophosphatase-like HAD family hydrolase
VAGQLGIAPAEVMAIGDDLNDVPMLGWAGLGVAMANARRSAREVAAAATLSNADHGVAHAIRRWVLPTTPASQPAHA